MVNDISFIERRAPGFRYVQIADFNDFRSGR
jgi:hypothetical protein